jgi:hypothetical protein
VPLLIFSAKPHDSVKWRFGHIIIAIFVGYVLINLTLQTHRELGWKAYEACQKNNAHRELSIEMQEKCRHHVNIEDGDKSNTTSRAGGMNVDCQKQLTLRLFRKAFAIDRIVYQLFPDHGYNGG